MQEVFESGDDSIFPGGGRRVVLARMTAAKRVCKGT